MPTAPPSSRQASSQFMRQGHTAGPYGNDPTNTPTQGKVATPPRSITPSSK